MSKLKHKIDKFLGKILIYLETVIAFIALVVLVALLTAEVTHIFSDPSYFAAEDAVSHFLHEILTIVVGLEFVKMLMHLTPENTLEVLIMAVSRHIIVSGDSTVSTFLGILCIVALFATKRYLIPKNELFVDMDEEVHDNHWNRRRNKKKGDTKSEQHTENKDHANQL